MRQRILVVDDNVDAAESLGTMLAYSGHDVRVAHGGVEALNAAREFAPNVMILDLGMPEMDGYEVARAVRSDPRIAATRLIALSGYGQPDDRRRTADVGFDEHLVKPVEHDVLNAALLSDLRSALLIGRNSITTPGETSYWTCCTPA